MKKFIRALSLMLVLVMSLSVFASCEDENKVDTETVFNDMALTDILAAVMNGVTVEFATMAEPLNEENFEYFAFLPYADGYEGITGDAMIGSIAHSLVIVKVPEGTDTAALAETVKTNADPRKWMCVEAEKVAVETRGNVIMLAMSTTAITDAFVENFKNYMPAENADTTAAE